MFLWPFKVFFGVFFLFVYVLATSQPIQPTNTIFGMYARFDTERAKKNILKIFISNDLRAIFYYFWRFYQIFHLMYIVFDIGI